MEKLLVLTGLNYENKARLYEEAKLSLKKFVGENISTEKPVNAYLKPEIYTNKLV